MNKLLVVFALLGLSGAATAQDEPRVAAERARIKAERASAETSFHAEERACYGKFAVNDCVNAAKARRRAVVTPLQRQEIALNDAERRRKAAERSREGEERAAAERRREESQRAKAQAGQKEREADAAEKAAARATDQVVGPGKRALRQEEVKKRKAEQSAERSRKADQATQNRERHERRVAEAEDRKAKLEKRVAARKKPAASALPVPP